MPRRNSRVKMKIRNKKERKERKNKEKARRMN